MKAFGSIRVERRDGAVTITLLHRVLRIEVLAEIELALSQTSEALFITGTEGYFAAGADIAQLNELTGPLALAFARQGQTLLDKLGGRGAPSIAAIDGFCLGGGLDLALACDFRYASARSRFAHPGGRIGILTGWGGTGRLPRTIGKSRALEMMVAGRWLGASEALEWGLIDGVVDQPLAFAESRHGSFQPLTL